MSDDIGQEDSLQLLIVTPDRVLFRGPVLWVQVPIHDGLLGIWPRHAPLIGRLGHGEATYHTGEGISKTDISGGILRVAGERCSLLTVSAETELRDEQGDDGKLAAALEEALEEHLTEQELAQLQGLDA